jgi:hypothetical protein
MTQDNPARNGKSFVDAFVAAMVDYIRILQTHRRGAMNRLLIAFVFVLRARWPRPRT